MTHSRRSLIATGVLALITGLLILFPARVAYVWFLPAKISLGGISGSVWHGSADEASVSGIYVANLTWRIKPWQLLTGKLTYHIVGTPPSGYVESDMSAGFDGSVTLTSLMASLPLEMFEGGSGIRGLKGDASLQFARIELRNGVLVRVDGTLQVANLIVPLAGLDSLGGYKAEFFTQNNGVSASIEDTDGVIDLAGSLQINADRTYSFVGQIVAKPHTPASILRQMQFLPPANARGQHEVRLEGKL